MEKIGICMGTSVMKQEKVKEREKGVMGGRVPEQETGAIRRGHKNLSRSVCCSSPAVPVPLLF